jgi:hypothetical protein
MNIDARWMFCKFCFKHEQCNLHWLTVYCYWLYPYFIHFIVHWMIFFAWMLDLCNDSVTCILCYWLVATLVCIHGLWTCFSLITGPTWIQQIQYNTIQFFFSFSCDFVNKISCCQNVTPMSCEFQHCMPGGCALLLYENGRWHWYVYKAVVGYVVSECRENCTHWD